MRFTALQGYVFENDCQKSDLCDCPRSPRGGLT